MADWKGLFKSVEENSELINELSQLNQQLMKLNSYPDGHHPRRKSNIIPKVEEEAADVLAALNYLIDRNGLNRGKITRRQAYKYRKFEKRWGDVPQAVKALGKKARVTRKKQAKKRASK